MRTVLMTIGALFLFTGLAGAAERPAKAVMAVIDADGVQRVEMVGGSYYFDPFHVTVKVNVPVELQVRKAPGVTPHNIVLRAPEAGINFDEKLSSEPKIIRFTPTRTGTYPFHCDKKLLFFESHQDRGMEGILQVVE